MSEMSPDPETNSDARALVIAQGEFRSLADPSPPVGLGSPDGEDRHPEPPRAGPQPLGGPGPGPTPGPPVPAEIYLTIDTEDDYFTAPHMVTGEGIGEEYGAYGILDILDRKALKATWFINVYEAHRHDGPATLERLVRAIDERGHEIAL